MTTNNTAANVSLNGLTANQMREALAAKTVTVKAVIAHLESKAALRAPSAKLLAELRGEAKPAAAKAPKAAKAEPKAEAPKPANPKAEAVVTVTAKDLDALLSRIAALEAKVCAKAEPKASETPKAETPKAAKGKKAKAEPVAEPVAPVVEPVKPVAKAQTPVESVELPAYSEAKAALEGLSVKALRAHAKELGIDATAKADIVDAMMAQALAEGEVFDDREGAEELASELFDMLADEIEGEVF